MADNYGSMDINYTKLNIDKCFKNHYVIPEYQREYVWENDQVEQLMADLFSAFEENPKKGYFMGILVAYTGPNNTFEVIDGQQRLTTFFIAMCSLIHRYEAEGKKADVFKHNIYSPHYDNNGEQVDSFCLELQYPDAQGSLQAIWNQKIPDDLDSETASNRKIYDAYMTINKNLSQEFQSFDELKDFAMYLFNQVEFVQIETKDISDALKIFETINQRGVGLSPMDLLKNLIFRQVGRDAFPALNAQWKTIVDLLDNNGEKPLRFLRYFITARFDITGMQKEGILPEDKIYEWLMANDAQCQYQKKPFLFVQTLQDSLNLFINSIGGAGSNANVHLRNISIIAGKSYRLHLLLVLAAKDLDSSLKEKLYQLLESLVVVFTINRVKANELEKLYASWCKSIRGIHSLDDLNSFIDSKVIPEMKKRVINPKQGFMGLNLNEFQKYRIRFILAKITKYVDEIRKGGDDYADASVYIKSANQIEHIMPQTCLDPASYDMDVEEYEEYKGKLGNLALLEKPLNTSIKDAAYDKKSPVYSKSAFYLTQSIAGLPAVGVNTSADRVNKKLKCWDKWDKSSIDERQQLLYSLAKEIWGIDSIRKNWN